jgi:hypothetical protein
MLKKLEKFKTFQINPDWENRTRFFSYQKISTFWAQMALAALYIISGPKSLDFQGPLLPMPLEMDVARSKIISSRPI